MKNKKNKKDNLIHIINYKNFIYTVLPAIIGIPYLFILYKFYLRRISSFGCFDDCFNIMGGYFISQGKYIYSDFFFNHQMLTAYISYLVHKFYISESIYSLILNHRNMLWSYIFTMSFVLLIRFRWIALGFILIYEVTKFYVFGDRFLSESFIVYPLVYLFILVFYKLTDKKIYTFDYIFACFFTWFIVFSREPYIPLALVLYGILLWGEINRVKIISCFIFIILSVITVFTVDINSYYFNVVTINQNTVLAQEANNSGILGFGLIKIFFYPLYVLFFINSSFFGNILWILSVFYLVLFLFLLIFKKRIKLILFFILVLGLANIRYVTPGDTFYSAFHMIPWYGLFITSIFLIVSLIKSKKNIIYGIVFSFLIFLFSLHPNQSFLFETIDPHVEYINNYGKYYSIGETFKSLSSKDATLYVDGTEDLLYWQAKLDSPYKYTWYTSVMPYFPIYNSARTEMFINNPPDLYYGSCPKIDGAARIMPDEVLTLYTPINHNGSVSCLFVRSKILDTITEDKLEKIKEFDYSVTK